MESLLKTVNSTADGKPYIYFHLSIRNVAIVDGGIEYKCKIIDHIDILIARTNLSKYYLYIWVNITYNVHIKKHYLTFDKEKSL